MPARPVALVTGSSGGFGPDLVRALRRAGWTAVSNGRSSRRGPGDLHVRADASTRDGARALVEAVLDRYGRLDLLACGVGAFEETPVSDFDLEAWDRILDSNLRSAWTCAEAALPALRKRRGSIVTFGGTFSPSLKGNPRYAAYAMAKTALAVFTSSLAQAEAKRGVRANMINPGILGGDARGLARRIPQGRRTRPADLAGALLWLASPAAAHVTGAVIDVTGGLSR
jgi:NAD(P)-dependent dehydrogenase (short-subunit alcohol dehydrogenase family)